jgi:hypothetical protein
MDEDEQKFASLLKKEYKDLVFLDNNVWEKAPESVNSIERCQTGFCYIWNKGIFPELPTIERKDGKVQGPGSGVVIQFQRCRIDEDGNLLSGRIAVGYDSDEKEFNAFINNVWKILKKVSKVGVYHSPLFGSVDESKIIKEYTVGDAAKEAIRSQKISRFKHRSTENYYVPIN